MQKELWLYINTSRKKSTSCKLLYLHSFVKYQYLDFFREQKSLFLCFQFLYKEEVHFNISTEINSHFNEIRIERAREFSGQINKDVFLPVHFVWYSCMKGILQIIYWQHLSRSLFPRSTSKPAYSEISPMMLLWCKCAFAKSYSVSSSYASDYSAHCHFCLLPTLQCRLGWVIGSWLVYSVSFMPEMCLEFRSPWSTVKSSNLETEDPHVISVVRLFAWLLYFWILMSSAILTSSWPYSES